jgi:hypothetical protein
MRPSTLLRTASVLTLVHCILHTIGGVLAPPSHGAEEIAVLEAMRAHRFEFMGSMRSYADFMLGYGLFVAIALLVDAVVFWQLATLARARPDGLRPIVALFALGYVGLAIVSGRFFFIAPVVTELLIAVCLAAAFVGLPRRQEVAGARP